ncbi:MAG: hypothetical protein NC184_01650 [Roseburia sp.]|nr:hypothetical protein [Roseburia sp.]
MFRLISTKMTITSIEQLLNDQEINYLADLFLARFGLSRCSRRYRYFKNAVILFSHDFIDRDEAYNRLARCADMTPDAFKKELDAAISQMPAPVSEIFNRTFDPPSVPYQKPHKNITMTESDTDDALIFLGIAFLYIISTNYPKYEAVRYLKDNG